MIRIKMIVVLMVVVMMILKLQCSADGVAMEVSWLKHSSCVLCHPRLSLYSYSTML